MRPIPEFTIKQANRQDGFKSAQPGLPGCSGANVNQQGNSRGPGRKAHAANPRATASRASRPGPPRRSASEFQQEALPLTRRSTIDVDD
jgi:hypothetical protein